MQFIFYYYLTGTPYYEIRSMAIGFWWPTVLYCMEQQAKIHSLKWNTCVEDEKQHFKKLHARGAPPHPMTLKKWHFLLQIPVFPIFPLLCFGSLRTSSTILPGAKYQPRGGGYEKGNMKMQNKCERKREEKCKLKGESKLTVYKRTYK